MLDRARALLPFVLPALLIGCGGAKQGTYSGGTVATAPPAPYPGTPIATDQASGGYGQVEVVGEVTPAERPGLGTVWGESVYAPVTSTPFVRAAATPWTIAALSYNDAEGIGAMAQYHGASLAPIEVLAGDGSIGISVVDTSGALLPGYTDGGHAYIVGTDGDRYRLVVRNGTSVRFEIVASVDGLDVIDGQPADPARRGYILDPYGVLVIDGFRQSDDAVAAFRFGSVADSYAGQTSGDRNVGVIGVAIFAEEGAVWTPAELYRRDTADPFPARTYATPP